jgi:hypothetical protein
MIFCDVWFPTRLSLLAVAESARGRGLSFAAAFSSHQRLRVGAPCPFRSGGPPATASILALATAPRREDTRARSLGGRAAGGDASQCEQEQPRSNRDGSPDAAADRVLPAGFEGNRAACIARSEFRALAFRQLQSPFVGKDYEHGTQISLQLFQLLTCLKLQDEKQLLPSCLTTECEHMASLSHRMHSTHFTAE